MTLGVLAWLGIGMAGYVLLYAWLSPARGFTLHRTLFQQIGWPLFCVGCAIALVAGLLWSQQGTQRVLDDCAARGGIPVGARYSVYCVEPTPSPRKALDKWITDLYTR